MPGEVQPPCPLLLGAFRECLVFCTVARVFGPRRRRHSNYSSIFDHVVLPSVVLHNDSLGIDPLRARAAGVARGVPVCVFFGGGVLQGVLVVHNLADIFVCDACNVSVLLLVLLLVYIE